MPVNSHSSDALRLLVGLGNPGKRYAHSRHNAGFLVLEHLAAQASLSFRSAGQAEYSRWGHYLLLKPQTFMNLSGNAVLPYMQRHSLQPRQVLVVHDDLDLPLGRLRFKRGGGAGGQKGVAHIAACIGADFYRLKLGIGRPPPRWTVEHWVLSSFTEQEQALLTLVQEHACKAITMALESDVDKAANYYNGLDIRALLPS